jgi:glucose uptake protein GlcU
LFFWWYNKSAKNKKSVMKRIGYLLVSMACVFVAGTMFVSANITLPGGTGLPDSSIGAVLANVTRFVTAIIAVLAILMIVVSGVMYITSSGDQGRVDSAKKMLTYAIIGLIVSLLAYVIVIAVGQALGVW